MLPSQRTLRDYTYDVDQQLKGAAKLLSCSEKDKCVIIIMDEMQNLHDLSKLTVFDM